MASKTACLVPSRRTEFPWGTPKGLGVETGRATLNMTGFCRLRSIKAFNWFSMYSVCCPASRGIG
jgi:hypothetical protein